MKIHRDNQDDIVTADSIKYLGVQDGRVVYWNNKELCEKESRKYNSKSNFKNGSWSAYNYSLKNNWLNELYPNYEK